MVKLETAGYAAAYAQYRTNHSFFPLIGAVLLDEQDGVVYADKDEAPTQFYVEHAFGFAQIFGSANAEFETELQRYLLVRKNFAVVKVRLYTPHFPDFLRTAKMACLRAERQRYALGSSGIVQGMDLRACKNVNSRFVDVDRSNVWQVERRFGVVGRFWRTPRDFIARAHAVVALVDEEPVAICYAAAVADGRAEIDVLTLPAYRQLGLGRLVVTRFNKQSRARGLTPLWDCFTNNAGSVALCQTAGFVSVGEPYAFFTINK